VESEPRHHGPVQGQSRFGTVPCDKLLHRELVIAPRTWGTLAVEYRRFCVIEIRQAEDDLLAKRFVGLSGHTSGLLCRRHAQYLLIRSSILNRSAFNERTGLCVNLRKPCSTRFGALSSDLTGKHAMREPGRPEPQPPAATQSRRREPQDREASFQKASTEKCVSLRSS
jgi:hypothetical protein